MLKGFVIGFFCFLLFLFLHVFIFHKRKIKKRFAMLARIFASLLPVYVLLYIAVPTESMIIMPADPNITPGAVIGIAKAFNFLLGILIYLLFFFGYCHFYFIIDRSISVRIMIHLEDAKEKKLNLANLKKLYNPDYIFLRRLKHMIDSKYIAKEADYYRNREKGRFTGRLFKFLKQYLQIGEGG